MSLDCPKILFKRLLKTTVFKLISKSVKFNLTTSFPIFVSEITKKTISKCLVMIDLAMLFPNR